jgi:UDP-glucuronate decarboxylase
MKTVMVTGGAGFLGSHLCERLLDDGNDVLCVDNFLTGSKENILHLLNNPRFELLRHDITSPLYVEVDEIYNLACPASPTHYQADPVKTIKTSVHGAINMLGLAKRLKAKILQASTSEVYGNPEVHPQPEGYWGRVNPVGPRSCYDEGKRCAETLFFDYRRQHRLRIKVVRIFNTFGPRMHPNDGRVVSNFVVQALKGEDITIYGDGTQTRSFCYVDDLIEAMVRFMAMPDDVIGPINIGNPQEFTVLQLAERVLELTGSRSRLIFKPLPTDDPNRRRPNIAEATRLLGWRPSVDLDKGLRSIIAYFSARLSPQRDALSRSPKQMRRTSRAQLCPEIEARKVQARTRDPGSTELAQSRLARERIPGPARAGVTRRKLAGLAGSAGLYGLLLPELAAGSPGPESSPPPHITYPNLVFFDDFASLDSIDMSDSRIEGYKWYRLQWWENGITNLDCIRVSDSILYLGGGTGRGRVQSAIPFSNLRHFIGNVWGGGAYFEVRMKFNPLLGAGVTGGLGAYLFSIEHIYFDLFPYDAQFPGQARGYAHFAELDIMELAGLSSRNDYVGKTGFQGTLHDWSGVYDGAPTYRGWQFDLYNINSLHTAGAVDWKQFHTYGALWVPQAGSSPGYVRWFFDDRPLGSVYWLGPMRSPPQISKDKQYKGVPIDQSTPLRAGPIFSVIDGQRLAMQLDGNPDWPILVDWVKVWQKGQVQHSQ